MADASPTATPTATFIADPGSLESACERARAAGVVAVDTESNSLHAYYARLCVVQLSFGDEHVVLDTLAIHRDALGPLRSLLADEAVEKVLHGSDYDVRSFDREIGARLVHLRDTQVAAQLLGLKQTGLAALLETELEIVLDKKHQLADWAQRPLPPELLAYATADTAYLIALKARLERRLGELGRLSWWEEECGELAAIRWEAPEPNVLGFERLRGASRLKGQARDRIAALHAWREGVAAALDRPPFKVMQGDVMLALAQNPPEDLAALAKVRGVAGGVLRRHGNELILLLRSAPEAPPRRPSAWVRQDAMRTARVREATEARDKRAVELGLDGAVLAPKAALEAVVDSQPTTPEALAGCLWRRWRAQVLSEDLLPLVTAWRRQESCDAEPV